MAEQLDWRRSITASERYDNIQKIQDVYDGPKSAFEIEDEAYQTCSSLGAYQAACSTPFDKEAASGSATHDGLPMNQEERAAPTQQAAREESPGVRIGSYHDCHYVAGGATSSVYRSSTSTSTPTSSSPLSLAQARDIVALKVIVQTSHIEPHNPVLEVWILEELGKEENSSSGGDPPSRCIRLLDTFRDQEQRLVLVFPYMPLTLADLLQQDRRAGDDGGSLPLLADSQARSLSGDLLRALAHLHARGIIHRDIKPSALLLQPHGVSPGDDGDDNGITTATTTFTALLSDFGTVWHPRLSPLTGEPTDSKVLDVGTGPYRAPEALFGDFSYGTALDMWAAGAVLAECAMATTRLASPGVAAAAASSSAPVKEGEYEDEDGEENNVSSPQLWGPKRRTLFSSRPTYEDGNQLGLILSIFRTVGSPTLESWPQAAALRTPPFEMYRSFPAPAWKDILPGVDAGRRELVAGMITYNTDTRTTAEQALQHPYFQ